ncbi:unnamed protein product [Coregonus sp. 'balchen']|nr:unnamed protein product [Coregonus sp. 'balchen']
MVDQKVKLGRPHAPKDGKQFLSPHHIQNHDHHLQHQKNNTIYDKHTIAPRWEDRQMAGIPLHHTHHTPTPEWKTPPADKERSRYCGQLKTRLDQQWHKVSSYFNVALFWATVLVLAFCYSSIARHFYKLYRRVRQDDSGVYSMSHCSIFSLLAVLFICPTTSAA